jgi:nucleoside-diphosphate kinase
MKSLVLLKPDAAERRLLGQLLTYFESNMMFKVVAAKMVTMDVNLCRRHYVDHLAKTFYVGLEQFMTSGPTLALVVEGDVAEIRKTGTALRDLFNKDYKGGPRNLVHASDSPEAAAREVALWFPEQREQDGEEDDEG